MIHLEVHYLETAHDAAYLGTAGFPRYDLEPTRCSTCDHAVGEVFNHQDEPVGWRPFAIVLDGDRIATACRSCFNGVASALAAS